MKLKKDSTSFIPTVTPRDPSEKCIAGRSCGTEENVNYILTVTAKPAGERATLGTEIRHIQRQLEGYDQTTPNQLSHHANLLDDLTNRHL